MNVLDLKKPLLLPAELNRRRRSRENLRAGTQPGTGIAVAVETPAHRQGLALGEHRHSSNFTMARDAAHPLAHMDAMVEIDVVGQTCYPYPL